MPDVSLENPWIFGTITVVLWVLIWGLVDQFLFDGSFAVGALDGLPIGIGFATLYLFVKRLRGAPAA